MRLTTAASYVLLSLSLAFSASAAPLSTTAAPASDTAVAGQTRDDAPAREGVALGSPADQKRYAEREQASPDAKNYKGGDTVVIGASALAVVLLVVLVIILI